MTDVLKTDSELMQLALEQAAIAASKGEVPVGAVIVSQNKIIGSGFNAPITLNDPTAHAEVQALRDACQNIQNYRLPDDSVMYVTLEPCTMCVGALVHARVSKVVFGATEPKAGSLISARKLFETAIIIISSWLSQVVYMSNAHSSSVTFLKCAANKSDYPVYKKRDE